MSESTTDPKLAALEKSLASLAPAPGRIDRDQLLFRAGQASMRGRAWFWPSATALVALVAVGLGMALAVRPESRVVERVVYVFAESPAPRPSSNPVSPSTFSESPISPAGAVAWGGSSAYIHDRDQAIRWGVEALPLSPAMASATPTSFVEKMLGLPEKKNEDAEAFRFRF
jgi:hypothetical protein